MKKMNTRTLVESALIGAIYVVVNYLQEIILPTTSSMPIQVRIAEVLCILCVFSKSAIYGVTVGCALSNIINVGVLPLDIVIGTFATLIAGILAYSLRNVKLFSVPFLSSLMPVLANGIIIGAELQIFYMTDNFHLWSFLLLCLQIAAGEFIACVVLGIPFYKLMNRLNVFKTQ